VHVSLCIAIAKHIIERILKSSSLHTNCSHGHVRFENMCENFGARERYAYKMRRLIITNDSTHSKWDDLIISTPKLESSQFHNSCVAVCVSVFVAVRVAIAETLTNHTTYLIKYLNSTTHVQVSFDKMCLKFEARERHSCEEALLHPFLAKACDPHVFEQVCMWAYINMCKYVRVYIYIHIYAYIYTHIHICIWLRVQTYIHTYMYMVESTELELEQDIFVCIYM